MDQKSVIIIGAGPCGLMAAYELGEQFTVTVVEARARSGGRIDTIMWEGLPIEAGAEFVHGKAPVTREILEKAGIDPIMSEGEIYRKKNGRFSRVEEMTEDWKKLMNTMEQLEEDVTLRDLLDRFFGGEKNTLFRKHVSAYAEGFDVADTNRASAKQLYREWKKQDDENFRVSRGYGGLTNYLSQAAKAKGVLIHTGDPVKEIHWRKDRVEVITAGGIKYEAEKLVITVSLGVLQQRNSAAHIHFDPSIEFYENKFDKIGFGAVIKLVLCFKRAFWQSDAGFILSDELFPTWWTQLPDKSPIITGWLGGPAAVQMSSEPDEIILQKAIGSLSALYDLPMATLKENLAGSFVFNWQKDPYTLGAYSYPTIGAGQAKKVLSEPLDETIFFAGEALYTGDHPGTVEAALVNGVEAAGRIRDAFSSSG